MKCFLKSILAGIMIGIGGTIFLSINNKIIGASFFSIGLIGVLVYSFNLYTGKIGYFITNFNFKYFKDLIIILLGNFVGAFLVGFILKFTRVYTLIHSKAVYLANIKLDDNLLSIFILSIFCGLLMYFAVNGYKTINDFGKYIVVYLAVVVFILCGFEHCIANIYYFSCASLWSLKTVLYVLVMVLGNSLGSFLIPIFDVFSKNKDKNRQN